jgi:hypothetical protein
MPCPNKNGGPSPPKKKKKGKRKQLSEIPLK